LREDAVSDRPVQISQMTKLRKLGFVATRWQQSTPYPFVLTELKDISTLKVLRFDRCDFCTEVGPHLNMNHSPRIEFENCSLADFNWIKFNNRLQTLSFRGFIRECDLKQIEANSSITELDLSGTNLVDSALQSLVDMRQLKTLNISSNKITDEGILTLTQIQSLKNLNLNYTVINFRRTLDTLIQKVDLRKLEVVSAVNCNLASLFVNTNLKSLAISTRVDSKKIISEKGLRFLLRYPSLTELNLRGCPVTDAILGSFGGKLRKLGLFDTKITNDGIKQFGNNNNIDTLELASEHITIDGLKSFFEPHFMTSLTELAVTREFATNVDMYHHKRFINIRSMK
jgi:Leucine-rich repeat (LRR) protein